MAEVYPRGRRTPPAVYNPVVPSARATLLAGLAFLTFFVGLGRPAITDSDEAFYAQAGREMVESGDWVTPHYNRQYRFEKPVLFYWLVAVAYLTAGAGEFAARMPSALAGLGLVLAAFACARRWYDEGTAALAGAITATSFGYVAVARQALPDLALACFITAATWAAFEALVVPGPAGLRRRGWLAAAGAALAAAFLTKGPVGVVLPALIVGPPAVWRCLAEGRSRDGGPGQPLARLAGDVSLLAAICLALTLPWFAAMTATHGAAYLERFFVAENMERFATARYNDPRPFWYYVPIVIGGLLPWSPLMLVGWRPVRRMLARTRRIEPADVWLGLWALAPLVFYSISIGKQPRYVLPVLPPLAILLARAVSGALARQAADGGRDRLLAAGGTAAGVVLLLFGAAVARAGILLSDGPSSTIRIAAILIALSGLGVMLAALSSRQRLLPAALAGASVVTTLSLHYSILSRPGPEPVEQMAALVRAADSGDVPYGRYRVFVRNLLYYVGRPHVDLITPEQLRAFLASSEPVLCVLPDTELEQARADGATAYELGRVSYLDTGRLTLRTLLWPDPAADLQTVVLATNRAPP